MLVFIRREIGITLTRVPVISQFPRRVPGLGLLLLRGCLAALLIDNGQGQALIAKPNALTFVIVGLALCLCIGLLTPWVAGAALLGEASYLPYTERNYVAVGIVTAFLCLSVTLLGAGAYSIDRLLYGRKRIVL